MTSLEGWSSAIELHPPGPPAASAADRRKGASYRGPPGQGVTGRRRTGGAPSTVKWVQRASLYERVGGQLFFDALVERFYAGVEEDPLLRPLYPEDLTESRRHLALFLGQYWGGPPAYSQERGHPRLRRRHAPFRIGLAERDAWLRHMRAALAGAGLSPGDADDVDAYLTMAATSLVNSGVADELGAPPGLRLRQRIPVGQPPEAGGPGVPGVDDGGAGDQVVEGPALPLDQHGQRHQHEEGETEG